MSEHTEDICDLCGGSGEVEITPFGRPDDERDSFGCPACIAAERDEEIAELKQQRDKLLAALERVEQFASCAPQGSHALRSIMLSQLQDELSAAIAEVKGQS